MADPTEMRVKAERLAAALRDNLKRRKSQTRGRTADATPRPEPAAPPPPRSDNKS
jgi:hypothetical protein